jgi:sugar transferase EpsL
MHKLLKRLIDIVIAGSLLVLCSPLIFVIGALIWLSTGWPILFKQKRAGYLGDEFILFKFRTMQDAHDSHGQLLQDSARITKIGAILRQLSLDEIPQLWNVWIGDMSLVGPRPLLMDYLPRYSSEQARRHLAKPGLTGWAQVNGRNILPWQERFQFDVWYVDNWSLALDTRIICKTIRKVLTREGISQHGHVTMPEFMGNDDSGS